MSENKNLQLESENNYEKKFIKKNGFSGIYTYLSKRYELDLFQIYKYLTCNNLISQNILLCNKDLKNEEINTFLQKVISCQFNSCFIIDDIELLQSPQISFIIDSLNQFFQKGNEKLNSFLIIFFKKEDSDIYNNFKEIKYIKNFDIEKKVFNSEKYDGNDVEIIISDKSGVGKSTQIKKDAENNKKNLIYFPLGGVFNGEDIINRLKELKLDNNSVLHLDLYENDQLYLINNFLFLILINRFYRHNEDIFFLPKDIQFKIELQNCFKNLFVEYPILNIFPIKELKISNLPPLIVPKELDSDIQIVANYLKALKENKINEFDLIFPNITPSEFEKNFYYIKKKKYSTSIKATLLPDIECQELIFNEIKEFYREPNYYQITSFIKVLSVQLKKFNQNFYLSAHIIITSNKKSYCKIRTIIVQSLIKLTKYFTKGAFTYFLENDKNMNLSIFENLNEIRDIDSKNINSNILSNDTHQIISFDKIESSLFFFHEGYGQSFSIITNKNPSDREYIDLLYLKNLFAFSERDKIKELPNYNKYTQKDFLNEIKEILDIRNPVYKEEKNYLISLEEICGDYVFTINNFIKFVLILLHISSNIPIIIMGDIGVGINSMIKKIFEIKNNGTLII